MIEAFGFIGYNIPQNGNFENDKFSNFAGHTRFVGCAGTTKSISSVDSYAAFAVVPGKGAKYHGYARGKNPFAASQSALRACGNFGCKIVQQYSVGQCAHIVLGTYQVFWNDTGFSKSRGAEILAHCKKFDEGCKTIVRDCIS